MQKLQTHPIYDQYIRQEEIGESALDERDFLSGHIKKHSFPRPTVQELRMEAFPVWYFSSVDASTSEIANLLDILIRDFHERTSSENLLMPSVIELSLYFQCPEIQIMDAFELLRRKNWRLNVESNYAKVYIADLPSSLAKDKNNQSEEDDPVDWRDITHDFYTDIVQPMTKRLATIFN